MMPNTFDLSYICNSCGIENRFEFTIRKQDTFVLTLQICEKCHSQNRLRWFEGERPRKMQEKSAEIQWAILETFETERPPLSVRRLFYVLANRFQLVDKNLSGYRTVQNQTVEMRRAGSVPYSWIADNSRSIISPETYTGLESAMQQMHDYYRRNLWSQQPVYVEFWIEKDSMAGVISPITYKWGVPLYVSRGFSSLTQINQAAETIKAIGKPTYIYQFGDFDEAGFNLAKAVPNELREEHGVDVHFERIAITEEQIKEYDLPLRPASLGKVGKTKSWPHEFAVDLDAMSAPVLRKLAEKVIIQHIDPAEWMAAEKVEEAEKQSLKNVMANFQHEILYYFYLVLRLCIMTITDYKKRIDKLEKSLRPVKGLWQLFFYANNTGTKENCVNLPVKSDIQEEEPKWFYAPAQAPEEPEPVTRIKREDIHTQPNKPRQEAPQAPQSNKEHTQRGVTIERVFYEASKPIVRREPNSKNLRKGY
jgi:hypothetical protein